MPFILITGWTRERTISSAMYEQEKTFPGCFSFAFLSLIGLEAGPCGPAGSIFHNKAKNMSAMFSLAQSMRVEHERDRILFLLIRVHLFLETGPLLTYLSRPGLFF